MQWPHNTDKDNITRLRRGLKPYKNPVFPLISSMLFDKIREKTVAA